MPARKLKPTFADAYAAVANDLQQRIGDAQAAMSGPPASVEPVPATDADRLKAWQTAHPEATDQAMHALAAQQYPKHLASGRSVAEATQMTAEDLTHFRYRGRLPLYTLGTTTWGEQVKNAEQMKRLAAKDSQDAPSAPSSPSPATPPEQGGY